MLGIQWGVKAWGKLAPLLEGELGVRSLGHPCMWVGLLGPTTGKKGKSLQKGGLRCPGPAPGGEVGVRGQ